MDQQRDSRILTMVPFSTWRRKRHNRMAPITDLRVTTQVLQTSPQRRAFTHILRMLNSASEARCECEKEKDRLIPKLLRLLKQARRDKTRLDEQHDLTKMRLQKDLEQSKKQTKELRQNQIQELKNYQKIIKERNDKYMQCRDRLQKTVDEVVVLKKRNRALETKQAKVGQQLRSVVSKHEDKVLELLHRQQEETDAKLRQQVALNQQLELAHVAAMDDQKRKHSQEVEWLNQQLSVATVQYDTIQAGTQEARTGSSMYEEQVDHQSLAVEHDDSKRHGETLQSVPAAVAADSDTQLLDRLYAIKKELHNYENKITAMKQEQIAGERESAVLRSRIQAMTNQSDREEKRVSSLVEEANKLKENLATELRLGATLRRQTDESEREIFDQNLSIATLENQIDELNRAAMVDSGKSAQLQNVLEQEIDGLRLQLAESNAQLLMRAIEQEKSAKLYADQTKQSANELHTEVSALTNRIDEMNQKASSLQTKSDAAKENFQEQLSRREEEIIRLRSRLFDLDKEVTAHKAQITQKETDHVSEIDIMNHRFREQLEEKTFKFRLHRTEHRGEADALRLQIDELTERGSLRYGMIEELRTQHDEKVVTLESLRIDHAKGKKDLRNHFEEANRHESIQKTVIQELRGRVDALQAELGRKTLTYEHLQSEHTKRLPDQSSRAIQNTIIEDLRVHTQDAQAEIDEKVLYDHSLLAQHSKATESLQMKVEEATRSGSIQEEGTKELRDLTDEQLLEAERNEVDHLKEILGKLRQQIEEDSRYRSLQDGVIKTHQDKLDEKISELKQMEMNHSKEANKLRRQIDEASRNESTQNEAIKEKFGLIQGFIAELTEKTFEFEHRAEHTRDEDGGLQEPFEKSQEAVEKCSVLERDVSEFQESASEREHDSTDLNEKLDSLRALWALLEGRNKMLQAEIDDMEAGQVEQMAELVSDHVSEVVELRAQLDDSVLQGLLHQTTIRKLRRDLTAAELRPSEQIGMLQQTRSIEREELEVRIKKHLLEKDDSYRAVIDSREELESMQQKLETIERRYKTARSDISDLQSLHEIFQQENQSLKDELLIQVSAVETASDAEISVLKKYTVELEQSLDDSIAASKKAQRSRGDLEAQIETLQADLRSTNQLLEALRPVKAVESTSPTEFDRAKESLASRRGDDFQVATSSVPGVASSESDDGGSTSRGRASFDPIEEIYHDCFESTSPPKIEGLRRNLFQKDFEEILTTGEGRVLVAGKGNIVGASPPSTDIRDLVPFCSPPGEESIDFEFEDSQEMEDWQERCFFLEHDRQELVRVTDEIIEFEKEAHEVQLEAILATAKRESTDQMRLIQQQTQFQVKALYDALCSNCRHKINTA